MKYTKCLFFLVVYGLIGCSDLSRVEEVEFEKSQQEYAIPLINTHVSLIDIFKNQKTEETDLLILPDSTLMLRYSGDVLRQVAKDIVPPLSGGIPIGIMSKSDTIPLPFMRLLLLKADLIGDSLIFAMRSSLQEDVRVHLTMESLLNQDGSPLTIDTTIRYVSGSSAPTFVYRSMDGLSLQLHENSLVVHYEAFDTSGNPVALDQLAVLFDEMIYSYLEGYFTKNDVNIPGDQIALNIYNNWIDGRLYFAEPKVTVLVDNSFGFPVRADIKYLRVVGRGGQKLDLESPINQKIDFLYPGLNEVGAVKSNVIRYDETNSNIEDILNIQPVLLEYDINAIANPDEDPTIIGFMTDSSFIRINVTVDLPVMGWANAFSVRDTVDFQVDSLTGAQEVEFKLVVDNGMPIRLTTQLVFVDENYNVLDSLFSDGPLPIEASNVDATGRANGEVRTIDFELMDEARLDHLQSVRLAIMLVSFLSKDAPNRIISIDANDAISMKLGAKIKLK